VIVADVPVSRSAAATFYARHGDVFAGGCILAASAGLLWHRTRARSGKG
jgi:hypothetical protein